MGGTSGIGRALALAAASRGAAVTVVGRTFKAGDATTFKAADLSSMAVAKRVGAELEPADIVLFTTGTGPADKREATAEGIERDMAVSALSRFVILRELFPKLQRGARVFIWGMPGEDRVC